MTTPINMLAIDLAKGSFQVCAIGQDGAVLYNRVLSRTRLASLLAEQQPCVVAMEACATSHYWGRVAQSHGHEVRLVPAAYVKPFVKRQKNDKADAEAIAEAALRPTMRFVAVKSAETQGRAVAFRTHQCLVRQRTQLINALRGHLAEFGLVAPKGPASLRVLEAALADETSVLPVQVREMGAIYLDQIASLTEVIERLAHELEAASKTDDQLRRLCTIPGIGPVTAAAVAAFAPDLDTFDSGRNFAAWLGAPTKVHWRQDQVGLGQQNGPDRHPPLIDRWRDERHPLGCPQGWQREPLAGNACDAQAKDGRGRCVGEQDGPDDLGTDDKRAGLQNGVTQARGGQRHGMAARPG